MIIHVTERQLFKQCRRSWQYAYREFLQPPVDPINASWIGRGIHAALAGFYRGNDILKSFHYWLDKKLPQPERDALTMEEFRNLQDIIELCETMLLGYVDFARRNDDFKVIAVEKALSAKIPHTKGRLVGTLDLLVRHRGRLWIYDHKSYTSFVNPDKLELDDQMTAYLWLVWKTYGEVPAGATYNQLRKKIPAKPYLLKSGKSLSKDKSIDTTVQIYRGAILEHGFNIDDYQDILEKLSVNEFYRRELIPRSKKELESFEEHLTYEYREMSSKHTHIYPNPNEYCPYCYYRNLCKAENEGGDVQSIKEATFVVDKERRL